MAMYPERNGARPPSSASPGHRHSWHLETAFHVKEFISMQSRQVLHDFLARRSQMDFYLAPVTWLDWRTTQPSISHRLTNATTPW